LPIEIVSVAGETEDGTGNLEGGLVLSRICGLPMGLKLGDALLDSNASQVPALFDDQQ
jgi:hypothetical protein